jgi:hypothetical protein
MAMTLNELRAGVARLEGLARSAPDSFESMREAIDSCDELEPLNGALHREEREILTALPPETAERLRLCSRGTQAFQDLIETGTAWVKILDEHGEKNW